MSTNLITAIAINIGILLLASWMFGAYIISSLSREKRELTEKLAELKKQHPSNGATAPAVDIYPAMEDMVEELREKEERIQRLLSIQQNQSTTHTLVDGLDSGTSTTEELRNHLSLVESDRADMEAIITELQNDLDHSRRALKAMEQEMLDGQNQAVRINTLERTERRMRDENKKLTRQLQGQEASQQRIKHLTKENDRLKRTVKSLATASNEQQQMIKRLHGEIERAAQLENHQRQLIEDLEKRLHNEKNTAQDAGKIKDMEDELSNLQETLKRTLIEKDFIEQHMLEMDDSLEKAKETEEALARARKEIETLEQFFPDFEPDIPDLEPTPAATSTPAAPPKPAFTTDIPELQNIMEDNRLFGSLQEFWTTLDTPPIDIVASENINIPNGLEDWVQTDIGNNDYTVLLSMSPNLAEIVTQAIFKQTDASEGDEERKDATGELGNIIAGTLATELANDFPVGIPEHIDATQAQVLMEQSALVTEMLASSQGHPIYAVLIVPQKPK